MMETEKLVKLWFSKWKNGSFLELPLTEDFCHTSPFGTIKGRKAYMDTVIQNKDKFLGYDFIIKDAVYEEAKACVRYQAVQGDFELEVSEWYYFEKNLIREIIAYYHIGEIREERQLETRT
ncbi:hypothetical protein [Zeaxanthinibacter enoshimensis]|uniref:hypothetical protein n=1 Tax=Zeaxanthinibacter enoshimensis TaxID=392009 RepID=UPI0035656CD5